MANRPMFMPGVNAKPGVIVRDVEFTWVPGMAFSQRQKCVVSLHQAINKKYPKEMVLEISSKSTCELGVQLSAYNLGVHSDQSSGFVCVESLFQCSKVFKDAGPFPESYGENPRKVREMLMKHKGKPLQGFNLYGVSWPLKPRRAFYNWVYCHTLAKNPELVDRLKDYTAFTDIEFNPKRSVNCQAYAVALYKSLERCGKLEEALSSQESFLQLHPPD